jgi:hypothetical protein
MTQTVPPTPSAGQPQEFQVMGEQLATTVEQLLHEGNVRRIILEYIIMPLSLIVLLAEAILGGAQYLLLSNIPSRASLWLAEIR